MLSFWESDSFTKYDLAIIGSGITGLSTAIELKINSPQLSVVILERGLLPTGASTKNAGFACVGSLTEILDDLKVMSRTEVFDLVKMRHEGLNILRSRLGDSTIDYQENGSYELCFSDKDLSEDIENINQLLKPIFKRSIFSEVKNTFGFKGNVKSVIKSNAEGQIDTGKMMKGLINLAQSIGIEIKTGFEVKSIENKEGFVSILNSTLTLEVKQVCVCTNAFSKNLLPDADFAPGRGQVLITKPLEKLPFSGSFHFDEGYYYFRTIGNRVLFGGGRQLDFKGESTEVFDLNNNIQNDLEQKLREIILPNTPFKVDSRWSGIMAFGPNKKPIITQVNSRVFAAVRLGGMGVAIGSKAGEIMADLMNRNRLSKP
ncbi:MAG: NAD(P)/FAD-dependent oxidoreductase [Crocinitomicaceae bacterium]